MRVVETQQMQFGELAIGDIEIDAKSRDDVPAVLKGLQWIYCHEPTRQRVFELLQEKIQPGVDMKVGRPGMQLWRVLVLAVLKQGLNCDFDRLQDYANHHNTVRQMLGHSVGFHRGKPSKYQLQTLIDNVSLLSAELLSEISQLVVAGGHELVGHKPGKPLRGRCDSFVVETNVKYPTDVGLLRDAIRCMVRETVRAADQYGLAGWRQHKKLLKELRKLFNRVRSSRGWKKKRKVRDYVAHCQRLLKRSQATVSELKSKLEQLPLLVQMIENYQGYGLRQLDQVRRRLLDGETIAHEEKVFSIFEPHTRWIVKGKAGVPVELGLPVCILEDQHQFVLHHKILWQGSDVDVAVPMVKETQARFSDVRMVSFDKGFHSPHNRRQLDQMLELNALPCKGKLSKKNQAREQAAEFVAARKQHSAVESAVNNLEHRGLDRVRSHGADGFARTVSLSVLAANVHRIGLVLQRAERDRIRRQKKARLRVV